MPYAKKKLIGVFGGSFDPPHRGHYKIATESIKKLKLNKLYWIVTKKNPFKKKSLFSIDDRIKKSRLLTKKNRKIYVKFYDKKIKSNKTIDILRYLIKKNTNNHYFLILGSDNLRNFHKWRDWKKILTISQLVVFSRKGYINNYKKSVILKFLKQKKIIFFKKFKMNISSSNIKKKLKNIES